MKKILTSIVALTTAIAANAMSREQAREQAIFLTDKMAYELNLTEDQYEAAYEINYDYLCGIRSEADVFGTYWTNRNADLCVVLADWQYAAFCDAVYFYRPIYWGDGYWHFRIYGRYPVRDFFYFARPAFVNVYVGGHCWVGHSGGWYRGRTWGVAWRSGGCSIGMRDGYRGTNNHGHFYSRGTNGNYVRNSGNVNITNVNNTYINNSNGRGTNSRFNRNGNSDGTNTGTNTRFNRNGNSDGTNSGT
ncbi:MAG: hypothetical protein HUK08_09765, partial [Bacteroidaceae bacterium]|nr:hypothetical protein [Bacteroidaceae bacterium]